jgi:hypothetical protein
VILFASLLCASAYAAPSACDTGQASRYVGYKVTRVDISNPLGFIEAWLPGFRSLHKRLTLKAGDPFSVEKFNVDSQYLGKTLRAGFSTVKAPVKLTFAGGSLEDCDTAAMTLRVVYPIFSSVPPSVNQPSIEEEDQESRNPVATAAQQIPGNKLLLTPLTGYDQTRGAFGGLKFSDKEKSLQLAGQTEDSVNSQTSDLSLGSTLRATRLWNNADWNAAVVYDKEPAGGARFEEGKLAGRFAASTQEFTDSHLMFRYGASLEGGHQQTNNPSAAAQLPPDSPYGSLKLYAGITGRPRRGAFSASYGFQLGDTFRTGIPLFRKHIVDLGYNYRIPVPFRKVLGDREDFTGPLSVSAHRTIGLETRFTAGLIQNAQGTPLAERFLGGNQIRPFVQDDSWVLPGDAFIRSIPENRLGASQAAVAGGTRFYSANITLSFTAWGRPFIPQELAASDLSSGPSCKPLPSGAPQSPNPQQTFPCILNGPFQNSAIALAAYDKTHDPAYVRLTGKVPALARDQEAKISAFSLQLSAIPPAIAGLNAVAQPLSNVSDEASDLDGYFTVLEGGASADVIKLLAAEIPTFQTDNAALTKSLRDASQTTLADQFDQTVSTLAQSVKEMQANMDQVATQFPDKKYEDQAWKKLAPGHRAIDVFLNELNLYSVAPVAIFDVARVWPVGQGVHYGIGPGLRLSLVNVNFTFGYAYTPQRLPMEKPGAILFSLDVSGLF